MKKPKTVIGITGPIASGKDSFCGVLKEAGIRIIDADGVGHRVLEGKARRRVLKAFGKEVASKDGFVDRKKLGKLVFSSRKELQKLNRLLHPMIKNEVLNEIKSSGSPIVAVNAAVLKEIGLNPVMDAVIAVISKKENRIKRLLKKMDRKQALARISSQRSPASYAREADIVVRNDAGINDLRKKAEAALKKITLLSRSA